MNTNVDLEYISSYPSIRNNPELNAQVRESALKALGEEWVFDAPVMTASEDFAYYAHLAPVAYFIVGVGDGPANHHPKFNPDEEAFPNGVRTQVQLILDYLDNFEEED